MNRFKFIEDSFNESIIFNGEDIMMDHINLNYIDDGIPNFIINDLDPLTGKMADFYNEVQFPNYDDCEDYASIYEKGVNNLFTKKLDNEIGIGSRILELGCGTGQLSLFLSRSNREIFAVDISNSSLILGENFRKRNEINNTYFMKMDVFDLKFNKNTFDYTLSTGVLHHTKNAEKAFKCLVEVTKPGGILVIGLYHEYGRILTRVKQKLAIILGDKISYFDKNSRKMRSEAKKRAWVKDQFMNPHETLHTPNETLKWFEENNVEFLNLIPHYDIQDQNLLKKNEKPKINFLDDFLMAFNTSQIQEGGFFIMIGRKK